MKLFDPTQLDAAHLAQAFPPDFQWGAATAAAQIEEEQCDAIRAEVEKLDVDALSPREALDALYQLKRLASEAGTG